MLIVAGVQVPFTGVESFDNKGNIGAGEFIHNGPIALNVGVTIGKIVILIVVGLAHCPASGVNVYTVVPTTEVSMVAGDQLPVIAGTSFDTNGKVGAVVFWHNGAIGVNAGVIWLIIFNNTFCDLITCVPSHCVYTAWAVIVVFVVGQTVVLVFEVKVVPFCNQEKVTLLGPAGKNRQASFVADHCPVFLPGGTVASVPEEFWIPKTPFPPFQPVQDVLLWT